MQGHTGSAKYVPHHSAAAAVAAAAAAFEPAVEQVHRLAGSLERQIKGIGDVLEQKLQKVDGDVLGQLDERMLE
jgi:hypothetical protein